MHLYHRNEIVPSNSLKLCSLYLEARRKTKLPFVELLQKCGYKLPVSNTTCQRLYCLYRCVIKFTKVLAQTGVACWPLVPKFAGSNPAEAVGFFGRKNPQHAFLRRGSKAVGPMS